MRTGRSKPDWGEKTSLITPCSPTTCKNRLFNSCCQCIESDARMGRFDQMKVKLSVVPEEEKQTVIGWIEYCRVETQKEADNLAKALFEIAKM